MQQSKFFQHLRQACALPLLLASLGLAAAPALPPLAVDTTQLTVSGISSGGYMAVQFEVAYSALVRGVGVLAAGPYYCAGGSLKRALGNCMEPSADSLPPTPKETLRTIGDLAAAGKIDAVSHLADDRVWLFSGSNDKTVAPAVMDALAAFYKETVPADALRYVKLAGAGHAMPSVADAKANACATSSSPFINRCQDFDAAGQLLSHLLGPLKPATLPVDGAVIAFDQRPYIAGAAVDASLADEGYAFVPKACSQGGCRVHVAFHGCLQNAEEVGRRFVDGAGYNAWAASNRIVVLYPQTIARSGFAFGSVKLLFNPKGCWDWWGYSGADYATRDGVQMRAVRAMVEALGKSDGSLSLKPASSGVKR